MPWPAHEHLHYAQYAHVSQIIHCCQDWHDGKHTATVTSWPFCHLSLQGGAYINQGPQFHGAVNVSASKDAQGYTAFAQADLQKDIDLVVDTQDLQDGVHCTSTISNYTSYVDDCMKANINSQYCLQPNSSAIQVNTCIFLGTCLWMHDCMYTTQ